MKPIPYGMHQIDEEDIQSVVNVLKSDWMTQGPAISLFEETVAAYHNCKYAVAFANGTAALHGAYYASQIKPGQEFITSNITFVATANGGLYMGATPALCDIDIKSYNIDLKMAWDLVNENTKVIAPVSFAGNPLDLEELYNKAKSENIVIIHDAAHAIGAKINAQSISAFAHMTILSFHPVKHVATGEGGMVLTNSKQLYEMLLLFRTHGITKDKSILINDSHGSWYYEMQSLGYNYRLTDLQAALGISQMKKLNNSLYRRNVIAEVYDNEFKSIPWITMPENKFNRPGSAEDIPQMENLHSYHLYPILLNKQVDRKEFYDYLRLNNIFAQVHYIPVSFMPYYRENFGYNKGMYPVSEDFYDRVISLPVFSGLAEEQQLYVIETVKKFSK